jgi:virginiamycin B lyase
VNVGSSVAAASVVSFVVVVLASCSGDVIGEFPSPPPPAITASPSPRDEAGRDIVAEIAVDGSPCFLAEAGGRVWVTAFDGNALVEIDPATNEVVGEHPMSEGPCGMAVHGRTLWIESTDAGTITAFDPRRRRVIDRVRIPGGVFGLTSTPSGLWGVVDDSEEVVRIDPATGRIVRRVEVEPPLTGLAVDGGAIWTISGRDEIVRIDPASRRIVERIPVDSFEPEALAVEGDTIWLSSSFGGDVLRVDRSTGRVRDRLPVDSSLFGGVVVGDDFWVSGNDGTVYRLDGQSGEVEEEFELVGFGPIPAAGNLWTVDFISNTVFRLDEPDA